MSAKDTPEKDYSLQTRLIHHKSAPRKTVNPAIERGSTLITSDYDRLYAKPVFYGRQGHSVHKELAEGLCLLEAAAACHLTANGLSACTGAIDAMLPAGGHLIFLDSLYGPTTRFIKSRIANGYWSGTSIGADWPLEQVKSALQPKTGLMILETPGSLTFDVPDLMGLIALAQGGGVKTVIDNTWSAGLYLKPLELGADVSIQALTKYVCGHADALGGAILTKDEADGAHIQQHLAMTGAALSSDDAYLHLRGLRTLPLRMKTHQKSARRIAHWLSKQPSVHSVLHPALKQCPGHNNWKRDFTGSSGLFSFVLNAHPDGESALLRLLKGLQLFKLGFSWGGFESLLMPADPQLSRLPGHWVNDLKTKPGPLIRLHIGQESVDDLICELDLALERYMIL